MAMMATEAEAPGTTQRLAIEIRFLLGTYQAASPGRITEPEWPPHPARLHAALLAAAWALGDGAAPDPEAIEALEWLERQGPPSINPGEAGVRAAPVFYVPRNVTPQEMGEVRGAIRRGTPERVATFTGKAARRFPAMTPGDSSVRYTWDSVPEGATLNALDRLVTETQYLGSSRSPVAAVVHVRAEDDDEPAGVLRPAAEGEIGEHSLRVAGPGFTAALIETGNVGAMLRAGAVGYVAGPAAPEAREPELAEGPFDQLLVLKRTGGYPLTTEHAGPLALALRRAVLSHAGHHAPAVLHGHGRNPHVAFLALPACGHIEASGEIHGLAAAVPRDVTEAERVAIRDAVVAVDVLRFSRDARPWTLEPAGGPNLPATLRPDTWTGPSRRWVTATALVLDVHTRSGREKTIEDCVVETLANAGFPAPERLAVRRFPSIGGAVPAAMQRRAGVGEGHRVHVDVTFGERVVGPVLAGRGRYLGLGLFRPLAERDGLER